MRRRSFMAGLAGAAALPVVVRAQPAGKPRRIGMLETIPAERNAAMFDAFRHGMRDLGYVEGKNLVIAYRSADGNNERFPELAGELVGLGVDVIVSRGTPARLAAAHATRTIPIVATAFSDPVVNGLVADLVRPGGNVTGLSSFVTALDAKRIEMLKEAAPGIARVAAMLDMSNPVDANSWKEIEPAANSLGLAVRLYDVRGAADIATAIARAGGEPATALDVGIDGVTQANAAAIVALAAEHRLPAIYASREFAAIGGLISYGVSYPDLYRRAAAFVDKIFKGAKPGDLPIDPPEKFEVVVNLKTAQALGLTMPQTLLARADEVIE